MHVIRERNWEAIYELLLRILHSYVKTTVLITCNKDLYYLRSYSIVYQIERHVS